MSAPTAITRARCHHHPAREAAARCVSCGNMFCSECVTLADHRMTCASCHRAALQRAETRKRDWFLLNASAQLAAGLMLLWLTFYFAGRSLLMLPDSMHSGEIWERFMP